MTCLQYEKEARQSWQQALDTASLTTDASLLLHVHKLLHSPVAITSDLNGEAPQQSKQQASESGAGMPQVTKSSYTALG